MRPGYAYTQMCHSALQVALPQAYITFPQVSQPHCSAHIRHVSLPVLAAGL